MVNGHIFSKLTIHDLLRWGLYAMVVLIPWVYSTEFESSFNVPKLTVFRVLTLVLVVLVMFQALVEGKFRWRRSMMNRWIAAYGIILALTTLTSAYFGVSFFGDQSRFLGLVTWLNLLFVMALAIQVFQEKHDVLRFTQLSVINAVALAFYGLLQWNGWIGVEEWTHDATFRVFGTFGHSNHFGAYLGFHLMLLAALFFRSPHVLYRWLYIVAAAPIMTVIIATASRGALGATLLAALFFGIGMIARQWEWIRAHKKSIGATLGVLGLTFILLWIPLKERVAQIPVVQRTLETVAFVESGQVPDRVSWWFSAGAMIKDSPLLGHGLGTFHSLYNLYRRTDYRVPGDIQDTFTPEAAHMEYFDIAATQGIIGLLVYLGMVWTWVSLLGKVLRDKEGRTSDKILALGFLSAGLVYFTQVLLSFGVVSTLLPLALMMGVSVAFYHIVSDPKPQTEQFGVFRLEGFLRLGVFMGVGILWFFSAWFTYRQAAAEWYLDKALDARHAGEVATAMEAYEKATNAMPWMAHYWEAYGQGAFDFTAYSDLSAAVDPEILEYLFKTSLHAYSIAYHQIPTLPHIPANVAIAELTYADFLEALNRNTEANTFREQGIAHYNEAVAVAVNNPLFAYNDGLILISVDRYEEAIQRFMEVLAIRDPYKDTYYQTAWLATELKDYDTARAYIQKALVETPGDENVKILLQRINSETSHE
jgi:O-antigen ligase